MPGHRQGGGRRNWRRRDPLAGGLARRELELPHHYVPRDYQRAAWSAFEQGVKRMVLVWHRRSGKDKTCLNMLATASQQRVGSYYYFLPTYAQGRKTLWEGMDFGGYRFLNHIPRDLWAGDPNNTEMRIELKNGSIFRVLGSDNVDSVMGTNPVGCVFSEFSLQDPRSWEYIRPILLENGGWAIFNGTPRGRQNHLHEVYQMAMKNPEWFAEVLGVDKTGALSEEQIQSERDSGMDEELVQQEYYCSFEGGMQGAYYARILQDVENAGRVREVAYDPMLPVHTAWDLGVGDYTSIVFYQIEPGSGEIRIIDHYETSGEGLAYYMRLLADRGYVYGEHLAPHDIQVRELGTGKSRLETARSLGLKFRVARKLPKDDQINAVRMMLPKCWFDRDKTEHLRDALYSYTKEYDDKNRCFKDRPRHDWSSHSADAMAVLAVGRQRAELPETRDRYRMWKKRPAKGGWMAA